MRTVSSITLIFILTIQCWMITDGTGRIFDSAPHFRSTAYDSLARSLGEGRVTVDPEVIGYEGMNGIHGTVMYFGAFPSLLRIPLTYFFPSHQGKWSKAMVLLSSVLILLSILALFSAKQLGLSLQFRMLLLLGVGLGSPLFFLASDSSLYHEAIIWGLCGSLWAIVALMQLAEDPIAKRSVYLIFVLGTSVALLSRVTFALPLLIASLALVIERFKAVSFKEALKSAFQLYIPLLPALFFQLWYNYERFGSPLTLINYAGFHAMPELMGGEFNAFRILDTIMIWFIPRFSNFSFNFPFIHSIAALPVFLPQLFTPWVERVIALPLGSPWCFFAGMIGAIGALFQIRNRNRNRREIIVLLSTVISCFIILSFYFTPERYTAEFLPFLFLGSWFYFRNLNAKRQFIVSCLIVLSIVTTLLSSIDIHLMAVADVGGTRKNRPSLYQLFYPTVEDYQISPLLNAEISTLIRSQPRDRCLAIRRVDIRGARFPVGIRQRMNCSIVLPLSKNTDVGIFSLKNRRHLCELDAAQLVLRDADTGITLFSKTLSDRDPAERIRLSDYSVRALEILWRSQSPDAKQCARGILVLGRHQKLGNLR